MLSSFTFPFTKSPTALTADASPLSHVSPQSLRELVAGVGVLSLSLLFRRPTYRGGGGGGATMEHFYFHAHPCVCVCVFMCMNVSVRSLATVLCVHRSLHVHMSMYVHMRAYVHRSM